MTKKKKQWCEVDHKLVKGLGLRYIYIKTKDNREGIVDIAPPFYGLLSFPQIRTFQTFDFYEFEASNDIQALITTALDEEKARATSRKVQIAVLMIKKSVIYPVTFGLVTVFVFDPLNQMLNLLALPPIVLLIVFFIFIRGLCFGFLLGEQFRKKVKPMAYTVKKKEISLKLKKRFFYSFVNVMMTFMLLFLAVPVVTTSEMGLGALIIAGLLNLTFGFNSAVQEAQVYVSQVEEER